MALTVGTDTFATLTFVDAYHADRGNTVWGALDDATAEINIRKGADWLNRTFYMSGVPPEGQRLQFPAEEVYDAYGRAFSSSMVPTQVQEANAIVAELYRDGTYDMEGIITADNALKKQKVDVIEVEYEASLRPVGGAVLTNIYQLMRPFTSQNKLVRA